MMKFCYIWKYAFVKFLEPESCQSSLFIVIDAEDESPREYHQELFEIFRNIYVLSKKHTRSKIHTALNGRPEVLTG
jgi:hypothetical protein